MFTASYGTTLSYDLKLNNIIIIWQPIFKVGVTISSDVISTAFKNMNQSCTFCSTFILKLCSWIVYAFQCLLQENKPNYFSLRKMVLGHLKSNLFQQWYRDIIVLVLRHFLWPGSILSVIFKLSVVLHSDHWDREGTLNINNEKTSFSIVQFHVFYGC